MYKSITSILLLLSCTVFGQQKGKRGMSFEKKTCDLYEKYASKVDQIEEEINKKRSNIYKENLPKKHLYKLTKSSELN
ncbi:hypothetical protein [Flammeovirga sp. EKP202]|uniref:hypothetical protein n=1 Tax=Flammeovirga sp. EKP202 TaxID=2770592 RepID=UPI00165F151B|nr:hypothetical protein [Flammeovirga sp. EKP202]MBD0401546.1 hypothetical protein [Flammeovirga sp. EKP202]